MKYYIKSRKITILIGSIKFLFYKTSICSKLNGRVFEDFIKNVRKDRYYLMCSIIAHDKQQPIYVDDESSRGGIPIPNNATT